MSILGLDVSTSCTGYSIMKKDGSNIVLVSAGAIDLSKAKNLYSKSQILEHSISELLIKYDIEKICIEENLQAFRPGMSSAKTIMKLAKFNGVACFLLERLTGLEPEGISVLRARSKLGIKIKRNCEKNTKEQVLDWVSAHNSFKDYSWPKKILKTGPRKGQEILDNSCFDIADAAVICLSCMV